MPFPTKMSVLAALVATTHGFSSTAPLSTKAWSPALVTSAATTTNPTIAASTSLVPSSSSSTTSLFASPPSGFLGMDDGDEDEEDEDDDDEEDEDDEEDDLALTSSRYSGATSPFTGMKLDPWDPNPLIKPRPSRYFKDDDEGNDGLASLSSGQAKDEDLKQTMTPEERKENLSVMRRIRKSDLPDLRLRKDHAGWVEANNDLKKRFNRDPWFTINERLRDAIQLGYEEEKIRYLQELAERVGGPPPGLDADMSKGYAVHTEIYDIGLSPNRAASMLEREIRNERAARGRAMMAERKKNQEAQQRQYEEDMRNPGVREDREAKERRERTMRRLMAEIEQDQQKKRERAKELLGKLPETPESRTKAMQKALQEAREEFKQTRKRQQKGGGGGAAKLPSSLTDDSDDEDEDSATADRPKSGADRAREAAAAEAAGGRPRLPGDDDVTRGELAADTKVEASSSTVTGPLQVEVSSKYNKEQSDPPMRKHCFQYTIRITNQSPSDTIQLLGRRFEIQTVGSSMKDVVQGEGVTGRTPVLKPGEVFEYTSTAPLSVRPLGTTIIAARMRGDYRYAVVPAGADAAKENGPEETAELGTFHFIFPEDQRVQPFRSAEVDEEDEEEDEEETTTTAVAAKPDIKGSTTKATASSPSSSSTAAAPASTLPGDKDMIKGEIAIPLNDSSEAITEDVRVQVTSSYRPERSDEALAKHCFAYNIRITNESNKPIQLVSRRFEIQTIGSQFKDVVQGPGVTGRQPILQPGESFEYTSTAPLSVKPMLDKTPVVARMQGEYNFVRLVDDSSAPLSSTPLQAKLALFHFILPAVV